MVWFWPIENFSPVPVLPSPGAFGFQRKHHKHEGVDLYAPEFTQVWAVEAGTVVHIGCLTGPKTDPPTPWWLETHCIMVEGESGVVMYGELWEDVYLSVGEKVEAGQHIGQVKRVLRNDKGRPVSMLHLELYPKGARKPDEFGDQLDPTEKLIEAQRARYNQTFLTRE